jgi:hypothetical protein
MSHPEKSQHSEKISHCDPDAYNPFDEIEFLPGLGRAVLCVVVAYVFVNLLMLPD